MNRTAYHHAEVEVGDGVVTTWVRAKAAAACPDVLRIFSGVTLFACRSCGRKCAADVTRCHCGERP